MRNVAILCLLVVFFPTLAFSQQTDASANELTSDSEADVALFEKYLEESQKLSEEFASLYKHLKGSKIVINDREITDVEKWERGYYEPLFERSKQMMQTVSGCDGYLSVWENKIPQRLVAAMQAEGRKPDKSTYVTYAGVEAPQYESSFGELNLLTYCTLAVVNDRRDEILKDTVYENSESGAKIRESGLANGYVRNPWGPIGYQKEYREMYERIKLWYAFPPRLMTEIAGRSTFDASWYAMAIYSYKNERSENLLYSIIDDPYADRKLADWAVYYLSLSPNSARFLPKVKKDIQERIASFQKTYPDKSSAYFEFDGEFQVSSLRVFNDKLKYLEKRYRSATKNDLPEEPGEHVAEIFFELNRIRRLLILKRSLEFNEKIPESEKGRFEIVRREYAISWALGPKHTRGGFNAFAGLKRGEERFRNYMAEYEPPTTVKYYWREDDSSNPQEQLNDRAFYESELAKEGLYSDVQKEYMQQQLEIIGYNEKELEIEKQREREEERNK